MQQEKNSKILVIPRNQNRTNDQQRISERKDFDMPQICDYCGKEIPNGVSYITVTSYTNDLNRPLLAINVSCGIDLQEVLEKQISKYDIE